MNLEKYFKTKKGVGALATSGKGGKVNVAVYSRPNVEGRNKVSFIMKDRLSRRNLKTNPKAAYMFTVQDSKASGIRLYLTMTGEETDQKKVLAVRRHKKPLKKGDKLFLVYFRVDKARVLVGDKEYSLT